MGVKCTYVPAKHSDTKYESSINQREAEEVIEHSSCPIGFIAGIECDGARYHSGLSVRDRDHIRQSVLEGLGWRIYRVWSTDWFADAARETAKLIAWLDAVREEVVNTLAHVKPQPSAGPIHIPEIASGGDLKEPVDQSELELPDPSLEPVEESADEARPRGRKLRQLGDIEPYEVMRGTLYELWRNGVLIGDVEVLKRATGVARLYGDGLRTSLPEYEGRVAATQESFKSMDLYAAMREVAARAAKAEATCI